MRSGLKFADCGGALQQLHHRAAAGGRAGCAEALGRGRGRCRDREGAGIVGAAAGRAGAGRGKKRFDAIIALGAVIRGETPHFDHVAGQAASGLAAVQARDGCAGGVRRAHHQYVEQAIDRAGGKSGNKGFDAAMTAIEMARPDAPAAEVAVQLSMAGPSPVAGNGRFAGPLSMGHAKQPVDEAISLVLRHTVLGGSRKRRAPERDEFMEELAQGNFGTRRRTSITASPQKAENWKLERMPAGGSQHSAHGDL